MRRDRERERSRAGWGRIAAAWMGWSPIWVGAIAAVVVLGLVVTGRAEPLPPLPDFMISGPIGDYAPRTTPAVLVNDILAGALASKGHFPGQQNVSYSVLYVNETRELRGMTVTVDEVEDPRWMSHEVELHVRAPAEQYARRTPEDRARVAPYWYEMRDVAGQRVFFMANGQYVWTSGANRVVQIEWLRQEDQPDGTFVTRELPEEFLAAYLAVLPSSLPPLVFDAAHEQQFIREEFDRDLEHAAYYLKQWEAEGGGYPGRYMWVRGNLDKVRERRHRYFGGVSVKERELQLLAQMKKMADPNALFSYDYHKGQYEELKRWWDQHRADPIDLTR